MSDLRGDQNQVVYYFYSVGRKLEVEKNGTSIGNTAFIGIFNFEPFHKILMAFVIKQDVVFV